LLLPLLQDAARGFTNISTAAGCCGCGMKVPVLHQMFPSCHGDFSTSLSDPIAATQVKPCLDTNYTRTVLLWLCPAAGTVVLSAAVQVVHLYQTSGRWECAACAGAGPGADCAPHVLLSCCWRQLANQLLQSFESAAAED